MIDSSPSLRITSNSGVAPGLHIDPGSNDAGWIIPGPVTLSDGTRVQLYRDGEALHAAYDAIRAAKHRICLEVYIFASDDIGRAFAELLCHKAREGVRIYVIYDAFGSIESDKEMFHEMAHAGISLRAFNPVFPWQCHFSWRPLNRDHRKLLIIDDDTAGLGGINIGANYGGSWIIHPRRRAPVDYWRDNGCGIVGPGARILLRAFAKCWHYIQTGGTIRKAELIHNIERQDMDHPHIPLSGPAELGLLAAVPTRTSPLVPLLRRLFRQAEQSIDLTMAYFAPSDDLITEIGKAARRGVRVRLMLPSRGDVRILVTAARSFYEKLMSDGVEIYERQGAVLHAKTMLIDRRLTIIGSTNLDYRSIEYNLESSALIRSAEFGQQVHDLFENDILYAKRIDLAQWRRRPTLDRITQWAVNRARYVL
ncbi:MAG TPA: phospholipase D-like domain-containing protein [Tepidisphaeraceae bacterium]|nr:phospholipase D-like domain-containing protein [Tepidisphaeraceae bacterium]